MKKIVGIVAGIIILAVIICGVFFGKDYIVNNNPEPTKEVATQTYENFLDKMQSTNDEDFYNNLLSKSLRERYTLEDITLLNSYLREVGKIKNFDKNNIKYTKKEDGDKNSYVISSEIEFENATKTVEIVVKYENGEYKISDYYYSKTIEF